MPENPQAEKVYVVNNRLKDFGLDAARGLVPGLTANHKFGRNSSTATGDHIWAASTAFALPVTAELCNVVSSDVNDDGSPPGTGAQTILITGVNELYDVVTETVTMNGTTNVSTVNKYFQIHRSYVTAAGAGGTAAGLITVTSTAAGTPSVASLSIGYNQTQNAQYLVPRNYTAYINNIGINVQNTGVNQTLDIIVQKQDFGGVPRVQGDFHFISDSGTNFIQRMYISPLQWPAKSLILFKCVAASAAFDVAVDYDIFLVAD